MAPAMTCPIVPPLQFKLFFGDNKLKANDGSTHRVLTVCVYFSGTDFQCNIHIIPVKNEEGVVMMFILNFDYVLDEGSDNSAEKISPTSPTKSDQSEYLTCPP